MIGRGGEWRELLEVKFGYLVAVTGVQPLPAHIQASVHRYCASEPHPATAPSDNAKMTRATVFHILGRLAIDAMSATGRNPTPASVRAP